MSGVHADARGWGSGYPNCQVGKIKTLRRADGLVLPGRAEVLPLVAWLMDETERKGYDIRPGATWGYACRCIRGYPHIPSNHSWGLAFDINADRNPMGNPLRTDMPNWMPVLWASQGFRWGGTYAGRKDSMHYEYMMTPADCARAIANLHKGTAPIQVSDKLPIKLHAGTKADPYVHGPHVVTIQHNINKWIAKHHPHGLAPIKEDGTYGKGTALYVAAFKLWVISIQQAFHQPVWPNHDTNVGVVTYGALDHWANN